MSHRPCVFFNTPNGCRKGSNCRFSHDNAGTSAQRPSSPSTPSVRQAQSRPGGNLPSSPERAPPGVCNFYWTSGNCKREFGCRFRHTQPSPAESQEVRLQGTLQTSLDALAPFLTEDGLARVTGIGTDVYFPADSSKDLSPTEAHNALKRFLFDDFRFRMTYDIYSFLKPLSSAHTANTSWVSLLVEVHTKY